MGNFIRWCCVSEQEEQSQNKIENNDNINNNQEHKLDIFSCKDIICTGIIEKVVDGDTLIITFKIPYSDLQNYVIIKPINTNPTIFFKFKCRLFGIDAAEKNTIQGQIATLLLNSIIKKNVPYTCKLHSTDKYGRQLVSIFDKNSTDITTELLQYSHPKYGFVYCNYDGKTKTEFTQLKRYKISKGNLIVKNKVFIPSLV
jgi:endonuclease YncB( thermonuclease family)